MASITSAASGNSDVGANWVGGVVPTDPDTVIIANGHTITLPVGVTWTVGNAADLATMAIATAGGTGGASGTGVLIVNGTLQLKGHALHGNATWVINAGGIVESVNTTDALVWYVTNGFDQQTGQLTLAGTGIGAPRAIMRNGAGAAGFRTASGSAGGGAYWGRIVADYTLFQGMDIPIGVTVFGDGSKVVLRDVVFDGCGALALGSTIQINTHVELRRVTIMNSAGSHSLDLTSTGTPVGLRVFEDVSCDKLARYVGAGATWTRCLFHDGIDMSGVWAAFDDCILQDDAASAGAQVAQGSITRGFRTRNNVAGGNWHGLQFSTAGVYTVDGLIFDGAVGDGVGDLLNAAGSGVIDVTVVNSLATKSSLGGGGYGKFLSMLGHADVTFSITHCTTFSEVGESGLVGIGETYAGHEDMVPLCKSNLVIGATAGEGVLVFRQGGGADANTRDHVTPAQCTHNAVYNAIAGGAGIGTGNRTVAGGDGVMFDTVPAAPLDVNPNLVDDTRNLATWYRSVVGGSPGTRTADMALAMAAMASQFTDSPVAGATIVAAHNWIRDGIKPTNVALQAAHDGVQGGWIGAVEGTGAAIIPDEYEVAMQHDFRQRGATGQVLSVSLLDPDYAPATGLVFGDVNCSRSTDGAAPVDIALVTMTLGTYASAGFVEKDDTLAPGEYAFSAPTLPASGNRVEYVFTGAGIRKAKLAVDLTADDTRSAGSTDLALGQEVLMVMTMNRGNKLYIDGNDLVLLGPDGVTEIGRQPRILAVLPHNPTSALG